MKKNSEWLKVVGAAIFEVMWVIGLKHASSVWEWLITVVAIIISFYVIISASSKLNWVPYILYLLGWGQQVQSLRTWFYSVNPSS